jgi:hypothetical protein
MVMLGQDLTVSAVAAAGAAQTPVTRPPPEHRVVEKAAGSNLRRQETGVLAPRTPSPLRELSDSARQFADLLDTTGSVQVAASISGFQAGHLDMYV